MWQKNAMHSDADEVAGEWERAWPCAETLKTLAELNEQCLELLVEQAALRAPNAPPILRELGNLWAQLDAASRRRAAGCPFLVVDAGFADPQRWRRIGDNRIADRETVGYGAFFTGSAAMKVAHQVFTNAWYIARTEPVGAALYLGMPPHCASLLRSCTVRQVTELANQRVAWLRPRWVGRTRLWQDLLSAAISGEGLALEMARLHGVRLLAMELKAFEQVSAKER
jgi:hypothetical protein